MFRFIASVAVGAGVVALSVQSAAPQIQNGKVELRHGASIDREISAVPSSPDAPAWVAWRVPMLAGDRDVCSAWSNDRVFVRGMSFDDGGITVINGVSIEGQQPQAGAPKSTLALEGGTQLVMFARILNGRVERLRYAGDDCPVDAGGRTVYWLDAITPAESLRFLAALSESGPTDRTLYDSDRANASGAVHAIGYHRDAAADPILDRLATEHRDSNIRHQAISTLAQFRGAHGVAVITRLLAAENDANERRTLTTSLGQSRDASAVDALKKLTTDGDARVRSEAVYYFIVRGGAAVVPEALKTFAADKDEGVRRRTISAIGRLPADVAIPQLLQVARTSADPVVRKEAVTVLSQSKDPRAIAFLEELIRR